MAGFVIVYGFLLAALSYLVRFIVPDSGRFAFFASLVGGGLCVLLGILAWAGRKGRSWVVLTMALIALVTLPQTVDRWMTLSAWSAVMGALLLTLSLAMTAAMLMYVLHGERAADFYKTSSSR